nr:ABC transporter substrate-binding protein [Salinibacterium sp.]
MPTPIHTQEPRDRRRRLLAMTAAAVSLGIALLAGCSGPQAAVGDERVEGGTIVYGHLQEPPCIFGGWVQQAYLSRQVLDSLVSLEDDGTVVPWLATDWTVSEDQRTWTFTLRDDVSFTDGTPLDAQAVSDNFEYWLDGGNGTVQAYLADYYESSRAVDATTLEVTLSAPYSPLLSVLSQGYFGIQSPTALARGNEANCEQPVGTGPFTVAAWKRGESVTFERNDDYNSAPANARHDGPAYVEGIEWRFLPDSTTRYGSLVSGETDVIYDVPSIEWATASEQFEVQRYITPGRPVALSFNTVEGPFVDERVRQAFAFASDRRAIVETVFRGAVPFEGNGSVSQGTSNYNAEVAAAYPYDPNRAAELLDAAGWSETDASGYRTKDGETLEIVIPYGAGSILTQEGSAVLQAIQQQVKDVGFKVTLIPVTQSELFGGAYSQPDERDIYVGYWTSPTAAILHINYRHHLPESPNGANSTFYNDDELLALIEGANGTTEPSEQERLYAEAQQLISDRAVAVGLYTQTTSLAVGPQLRDVWLEASQGEPVFHDAYFVQ